MSARRFVLIFIFIFYIRGTRFTPNRTSLLFSTVCFLLYFCAFGVCLQMRYCSGNCHNQPCYYKLIIIFSLCHLKKNVVLVYQLIQRILFQMPNAH